MFEFLSFTLITVVIADLLATSGDIMMTWTSPILPKLYSNDSSVNPFEKPINSVEESWIGSLINVGAMVGALPFGYIAERFGRKLCLLTIAVPYIISYLTLAFSRTIGLYYFARLLAGVSVGGAYTVLPMYVAEVSEDSNRGMTTASLNIFWTLGNLLPYVIGPYTPVLWFNVIMTLVPFSFFLLFLAIAPESPYYLVSRKREPEAEACLLKLRSQDRNAVASEIKYIQFEVEKNKETGSILDLFKSKIYRKGLIIAATLMMFQQLSGINAVLFYTQEIFQDANSGLKPEVSSIIIGLVIFISSFITPLISDKLGRKILILISCGGMILAHSAMGVYFYLKKSTDSDVSSISWLPISSLVLYIIMFNLGLGPVSWTLTSELFPTAVKSYASSIVSFVCWLTSFVVTRFFEDLNKSIGTGETFWLFAGFCLLALIFTIAILPETKGKSFQEIQELLR